MAGLDLHAFVPRRPRWGIAGQGQRQPGASRANGGFSWNGKPAAQGASRTRATAPKAEASSTTFSRLAASLKQEEARNGEEFKAIGILGSDIYDKLLLLQALRQQFPAAVFFTTDLNARLAWPGQWQWTRNVIIASHYGLELHPQLQSPIPAFRDGYQTSLFYTALWALDHFVPAGTEKSGCPDCFRPRAVAIPSSTYFSPDAGPRLFEVGRSGAFDISVDKHPPPSNAVSVHAPRPDMERWERWSSLAGDPKWIAACAGAATLLVLAAILLSSSATQAIIRLAANRFFWMGLAAAVVISYGLLEWMRKTLPNDAAAEPLVLTEGISAWPTALIRLLALVAALIFLVYSCWKLKKNEKMLERDFDLGPGHAAGATADLRREQRGQRARSAPPAMPPRLWLP